MRISKTGAHELDIPHFELIYELKWNGLPCPMSSVSLPISPESMSPPSNPLSSVDCPIFAHCWRRRRTLVQTGLDVMHPKAQITNDEENLTSCSCSFSRQSLAKPRGMSVGFSVSLGSQSDIQLPSPWIDKFPGYLVT